MTAYIWMALAHVGLVVRSENRFVTQRAGDDIALTIAMATIATTIPAMSLGERCEPSLDRYERSESRASSWKSPGLTPVHTHGFSTTSTLRNTILAYAAAS
jgi:hypothetical protein